MRLLLPLSMIAVAAAIGLGVSPGSTNAAPARAAAAAEPAKRSPLAQGPEAMDRELARVAPLVREGGYVPSTDHSIPPDVSFPNYCCFMEKLRSIL